jgi:transposase
LSVHFVFGNVLLSMKAYSLDLRARIVAAVDAGELTQKAIATRFCVTARFVSKLLAQRRERGHFEPLGHGGGQKRRVDLEPLRAAVAQRPDISLKELQEQVRSSDGGTLSLQTFSRWLTALGWPRKKRLGAPPKPTKRNASAFAN